MSDTAIARQAETPVAEVQNYSAGLLAVIERAARDPSVDIDKMERLLQMQERVQERDARSAFTAALAEMQPLLPVITERGKIIIRDRADASKIIQETGYALWEDINEVIRPLLERFGFALSFRTGQAADGKLVVTGLLKHRAGHEETCELPIPHDSSGSKNAVQAIGSSLSYGKRYTAIALLNITTKGEDDDADTATHMRATGEPMARAKLDGKYPSAAKLKEALREFANKLRTTGDVDALQREYKEALTQAQRDMPAWINGDDSGDNPGIRKQIAARREELAVNPSLGMLIKGLQGCDTTTAMSSYADSHSAIIDELDDAQRREFERAYDARESAVKTMGSRN
jgi:hypothetical protein